LARQHRGNVASINFNKQKEYYKMSKSKARKSGVTTYLLIFALVAVLIAGSLVLIGKSVVSKDFKERVGITETLPAPAVEVSNAELFGEADTVTAAPDASFRLAPMSLVAAGNTLTVTATVTPETATNKNVDWSVAWVNPASTWAAGKTVTSYVAVTPASNGALTATLTKIADFAEQVRITCRSREDTTVSATATVDLRKKLTAQALVLDAPTGTDYTLSQTAGAPTTITSPSTTVFAPVAAQTVSAGTLDDTYTVTKKIVWNEDIMSILPDPPCEEVYDYYNHANLYSGGLPLGETVTFDTALMTALFSASVWNKAASYNALIAALNAVTWQFRIRVVATGAYSTLTTDFYFRFPSPFFVVKPANIGLNDSAFVF
jgi:hypothetical protein